jgi:hypothetical protein
MLLLLVVEMLQEQSNGERKEGELAMNFLVLMSSNG